MVRSVPKLLPHSIENNKNNNNKKDLAVVVFPGELHMVEPLATTPATQHRTQQQPNRISPLLLYLPPNCTWRNHLLEHAKTCSTVWTTFFVCDNPTQIQYGRRRRHRRRHDDYRSITDGQPAWADCTIMTNTGDLQYGFR